MERLLHAKVEPGCVAIHWLGQGSFALKAHAGDIIVVDPYLSDSAATTGDFARLLPIPIKPKDVRLDYLFLTHDDIDHTDPQTLPALMQANSEASVICPPSCAHHLAKLGITARHMQTAMPGQALEFANFTGHVVAAEHTEDSVGYVFEFNEAGSATNGAVVYLTGDTEYNEGLAPAVAEFAPDILIVPIDGRDGSMDAAHAARLAREVGPREVIPMHYGLFASDPADADEFLALLAAETQSNPNISDVVIKHNNCHIYSPSGALHGRQAHKMARAERARQARGGHAHGGGRSH